MIYKASLDKATKAITLGVTILFAIIIIGQYAIIKDGSGNARTIYTTVGLLVIYFLAFAFRPMRYSLTTENLIVHRLFSNVKIERGNIKSVELIDKEKLSWSFRVFGVGGFYGYFGKFTNTKLGTMTWYATRKDKLVLVEMLNNKKIILTPDDAERFLADCNA
jgi:Bacterial PH domain